MENIRRECKSIQGGVSKIYLLPYVKYSRNEIKIVDNILTLFPSSDYFLFESFGDIGINQNMSENEGGKFYEYNFSIRVYNHSQIENIINMEFRALALDRLGNNRMLGLYNGLNVESVNKSTGSGKSDFNGYVITFSAKEKVEAPFLGQVEELEESYLLQENGSYLLQENLSKIKI